MDDDLKDFNPNSDALDDLTEARDELHGALALVDYARVDNGGIAGRSLDRVLEHLLKTDRYMRRAAGRLIP